MSAQCRTAAGLRYPGRAMNSQDVLAVIVSYNGLAKTREAAEALIKQVGHVHIVDNGSDAESLRVLEQLERERGITVQRLGTNRGVGHALNQGVRRARQTGCAWLLTMDQDSVVDAYLIDAYGAALKQDPQMVCLAPRIVGTTGKKALNGGVVDYAITSGNLVRVSLFDELGPYDEGFFVDCIDFDFCLRLRRLGHKVYRVPTAVMRHQLGDSVELPSSVRRYYARHSPVRRYYMYRNFMYMAERYLLDFPLFILKLGLGQVLLLVLIGVMDPRPLESFRAIAQGIRDYFARRSGPYMEHV